MMNETQLYDYINDELSQEDRFTVEQQLLADPAMQQQYEQLMQMKQAIQVDQGRVPSQQMRQRFASFLMEEVKNTRRPLTRYWRHAAAILLLTTFGSLIYFNQQNKNMIHAGIQELELRKTEFLNNLNEAQSSSRIAGVQMIYQFDEVDQEIANQLESLLLEDESSNVRLATVKAIAQLRLPEATQILLKGLRQETNPVVQIALINGIVALQDQTTLGDLQSYAEEQTLEQSVQQQLDKGIFTLQTL